MIHKQFIEDKKIELDNIAGNNLLKKSVTTQNNHSFNFVIEGVHNTSLDINKNLPQQIISNKVSELVYFSFEIQRQILLIYKDSPENIPKIVLERILKSITNLKNIISSSHDYEWYDHCVTNRALFLRDFLIFLAKCNNFSAYSIIYQIHRKHIRFIANNLNYDYLTNHGIITDTYGLMALRGLKDKSSLLLSKKIYNRSVDRIDHYISDDGVPLESSSTYWFLIYKLYKRILEIGLKYFNFKPIQYQFDKLKRTEDFFDLLYLNGQYLRIGQASGAHQYPSELYTPKVSNIQNSLIVNRLDTGLIIINGYDNDSNIFFQLLINTQIIYPKIHGHEDNGIISLYYKGKIYLDTPGSYKFKDINSKVKVDPKSFKNQSVCYEQGGNYLNEVHNINTEKKEKVLAVNFELSNNNVKIKREITIDLKNSKIIVQDTKLKGGENIVSQFLLHSKGEFINDEYQVGDIRLKSNNNFKEKIGYTSKERGQVQEVPLLGLEDEVSNRMEINIDFSSIDSIQENTSNIYYNKRKPYYFKMFINKMNRRIIYMIVKINKKINRI